MSNFMPSDHDLRTALIFCYHLKKIAAESHQMLIKAYGGNALSQQLNVDQSIVFRRLKAMDKIIKVGGWVPHELTNRQQENRKIMCEMLFARYKRRSYLHRIVTGDEKWIYFENLTRNSPYVDRGQPSKSTAWPNRLGRTIMLCIFWNQDGPIFYELLKHGETINTDHYKQQFLNLNDALLEKCEQCKKRQHKMIFLDDNTPSHCAKPTKDIVKELVWEPLAHAAYSPDLAPSALADQRFTSYENVKSCLDDWLASKDRSFFGVVFTNCPKDGENM
ncbi:mariner Mos1 transposase [Trichonephila clavipes]|nr:mariner Mos1 transposase [Trichonephila clavipes]